ncbi:hypothetical protein RQP46_010921 [Phenoliferia psychrophenolica]
MRLQLPIFEILADDNNSPRSTESYVGPFARFPGQYHHGHNIGSKTEVASAVDCVTFCSNESVFLNENYTSAVWDDTKTAYSTGAPTSSTCSCKQVADPDRTHPYLRGPFMGESLFKGYCGHLQPYETTYNAVPCETVTFESGGCELVSPAGGRCTCRPDDFAGAEAGTCTRTAMQASLFVESTPGVSEPPAMSTLPDPQFALPPLSAFKFAPFIFLQVVLLHPAFSNAVSRPLRFLLIFPALWYSARAPFHRIEPAHLAIGANWRLGVFGPELCLKALEWGLAVDRKPYQWIGFDGLGKESDEWKEEDSTKKKEGAEESLIPRNPDGTPKLLEDDIGEHGRPAVVTAAHSVRAGQRDGPWRIFLSSLHLLTAMRGIGYAFGPPAHSLAPPPPREPRLFLKYTLSTLLQAHVLNTACVLLMINRDTTLPHFLHTYLLPFLPLKLLTNISHIIAYMFVPISLHFQIVIGLSAISLLFFAFNNLFRTILPTSLQPARFDAREWPPLFNRAFAPRSVTHFWGGGQWHHLFRKPFTFVGYDPVVAVLSPLAGKPLSRMVGALAVFVLSGQPLLTLHQSLQN